MYRSSDFVEIANNLTVEQICRVVNRLLQNASTIENRRQYILSVLCGNSAVEKSCAENANFTAFPSNQLFAKHELYAKKVAKYAQNREYFKNIMFRKILLQNRLMHVFSISIADDSVFLVYRLIFFYDF